MKDSFRPHICACCSESLLVAVLSWPGINVCLRNKKSTILDTVLDKGYFKKVCFQVLFIGINKQKHHRKIKL